VPGDLRSAPVRLRSVAAVDRERVRQWLRDLDSDKFAVRQKAHAELERHVAGPGAVRLLEALAGGAAESRQTREAAAVRDRLRKR
jgi:hypothetical protein